MKDLYSYIGEGIITGAARGNVDMGFPADAVCEAWVDWMGLNKKMVDLNKCYQDDNGTYHIVLKHFTWTNGKGTQSSSGYVFFEITDRINRGIDPLFRDFDVVIDPLEGATYGLSVEGSGASFKGDSIKKLCSIVSHIKFCEIMIDSNVRAFEDFSLGMGMHGNGEMRFEVVDGRGLSHGSLQRLSGEVIVNKKDIDPVGKIVISGIPRGSNFKMICPQGSSNLMNIREKQIYVVDHTGAVDKIVGWATEMKYRVKTYEAFEITDQDIIGLIKELADESWPWGMKVFKYKGKGYIRVEAENGMMVNLRNRRDHIEVRVFGDNAVYLGDFIVK